MANIVVQPKTWAIVFDKDTDGTFRTQNFKAKVKRATAEPTDGGMEIESSDHGLGQEYSNVSDGTNALYIYNRSTNVGIVQVDI